MQLGLEIKNEARNEELIVALFNHYFFFYCSIIIQIKQRCILFIRRIPAQYIYNFIGFPFLGYTNLIVK